MIIRESTIDEAQAIVDVITSSIKELCIEDHNNDPAVLCRWLDNKTTQTVEAWISAPDSFCFSAINDANRLIGFSMMGEVKEAAELLLLYVKPDQKGAGAGKALLRSMEAVAITQGFDRMNLDSTNAALAFYQHHGFKRSGECGVRSDGLSCNRLSKELKIT